MKKSWILIALSLAGCNLNKGMSTTSSSSGGGGDTSGGGGGDTASNGGGGGNYPPGCINESNDPNKPCWSDMGPWKARNVAVQPPAKEDETYHVIPWGGPMSDAEKTCDVAANHCIRGGFFTESGTPVFLYKDQIRSYRDPQSDMTGTRLMYATVPGNASNLHDNVDAIVLEFDPNTPFPTSESDALTSKRWGAVRIDTVDVAKQEIHAGSDTYPFDHVRAIVEIVRTDSDR